jgi:hypothetical protein
MATATSRKIKTNSTAPRYILPSSELRAAIFSYSANTWQRDQFHCSSPERPLVARDEKRIYLTVTLDPACAVPASPARPAVLARQRDEVPVSAIPGVECSSPVSVSATLIRSSVMSAREPTPPERNGHVEPSPDAIDLVAEAEAIRTLFVEAVTRMIRLVNALKSYKRERRSLQVVLVESAPTQPGLMRGVLGE